MLSLLPFRPHSSLGFRRLKIRCSSRECCHGLSSVKFSDQLGVLTEPVAVTAHVDYVAVADESVNQGAGHDLIAEGLAPLLEACSWSRAMSWKKSIAPVLVIGR